MSLPLHPFDDDKLREECGVFGIIGVQEAANFVALGLHALQHRGQEAGGIVAYDASAGFTSVRRFGYVRDNFTSASLMETLPGSLARYVTESPSGSAVSIVPVTTPVPMSGRSTEADDVGRWLNGLMRTVTLTGVTPPFPSSTATVNVSVRSSSEAPVWAAA